MRTLMLILSFLVVGLIVGWLISYFAPQLRPEYTAETFIRVLPGTEKNSAATLIRHQNTLILLADRDKIQQTKWFKGLGETKDERLKASLSELKEGLRVRAMRGSDLIRISITCNNGDDAAVIANEIAFQFVSSQGGAKRKEVAEKLARLSDQQVRIQRDLDLAERSLDDVRRRYGFTDIEEHNYPHPFTVRLIRLQNEEDNCALDINQLQTRREAFLGQPKRFLSAGKPDPNQAAEIKDIELKIKLSQSRCEEIEKMREATEKQQEELDLAKAQYARQRFYRDDRQNTLQSVLAKMEDLKILYDNPDIAGLQLVDIAPIPLQADILPWQIPVSIAGGAGLLIGIICALLTGKTRKPNLQD